MQTKSLDASFTQIRDIIDRLEQLTSQNDVLVTENARLKVENDSLRPLADRVADLERRLGDARRTKKTIQKIEELEQTAIDLQKEVASMEREHDKNFEAAGIARMYVDRLNYIAMKLKIKPGHRGPKELLSAIEDAVRKII